MFSELIVVFSFIAMATSDISKINTTDLSKITWAHAVNNQALLKDALKSDVNMLEADISLGKLSESDKVDIPIMAHPPAIISNLSLEQFLIAVNNHNVNNSNSRKGVKLDFKSIEAFNASVKVLIKDNIKDLHPIWLNADILPGPINATTKPVDAKQFITISKDFDNITLSIGWTTNYNKSLEGESYTDSQIDEMITTIKMLQVSQPITFPVRAGIAAHSYEQMKRLVDNVTDSTLTIWSSENDPVDAKKLRALILDIGLNKIYIDVPEELKKELDLPSAANRHVGLFSVTLISIFVFVLSTVL